METKRGGERLVYQGLTYRSERNNKNKTKAWKCDRNEKCTGRATTAEDKIATSAKEHTHDPNPDHAERAAVKPSIKGLAFSQPTTAAHDVVAQASSGAPASVLAGLAPKKA